MFQGMMRALMRKKLNGIPPVEQDRLIALVEKNPELFTTIAQEIQTVMRSGKDQTTASMQVMQKYQAQLRDLIQ